MTVAQNTHYLLDDATARDLIDVIASYQPVSELQILSQVLQLDAPLISPFETEDIAAQKRRTTVLDSVVRNRVLAARLKQERGYRCDICNEVGFLMPDGTSYCETHHIEPLGEDGLDTADNIAVLCPGHHREVHHGQRAKELTELLEKMIRPNR